MPYRTQEFVEPPRCTANGCTYPPCECGGPHDSHYWFNSEFMYCQCAGLYDKTPAHLIVNASDEDKKRGYVKHQPKPYCKCERYKEKK